MLLTVDVGNTSTVCGVFERNGTLKALFRFKTQIPASSEELLVLLKNFLELFELKLKNLEGIAISCVVPPLLKYWEELGQKWLGKEVLVADSTTVSIPTELLYPTEAGADRLVNALAGWEKYKTSLIIVDFGTAITFDCVSEKGVYLGGAIAPGIYIAVEALFKKTAKLPKIDLSKPPSKAIGKDTISALKSGLILGFTGLTDFLIKKLEEEMKTTPKVIATGGLAYLIAPFSQRIEKIEPYLILEGLYFLWKKR